MTNSAQQLMHQAALLLDEAGDVEGAEAALRDAIDLAETAGRAVESIQARTFLGELLLNTERPDEAMILFEEAVEAAGDPSLDTDAVAIELRIARAHLEGSRS